MARPFHSCKLLNIRGLGFSSNRVLTCTYRVGRAASRVDLWPVSTMRTYKQRGFSLIELLIVVVIILVLAAIAIPNLLRSKMSANEASAIASVRTIITSEII